MEPGALIADFERAWSGRDQTAFEGCCHEQIHYEDPFTSEPLQGLDALCRHARKLWRAFPDVRVEQLGERLAGGAYVVAPVKLLGTHRGPLGPVPASRRFVVVHALAYCEIADARLLRVRAFFDAYQAGVELGIVPKPGSLGERTMLALRGFGLRRD